MNQRYLMYGVLAEGQALKAEIEQAEINDEDEGQA
jgi:hypothetical protein